MRKSPSTLIDISGRRFGWWTVVERAPNRYGKAYYKCRCRCGFEKEVGSQQLRQGRSNSCGCYGMRRSVKPRTEQHGKAWSKEEKELLRTYYPINGKRGLKRLLQRSPEAINTMAKKLGVKVGHSICPRSDIWGKRELQRLKELYPKGGIAACRGKFPLRTEGAIMRKAYELKLRTKEECNVQEAA